MAAAPARTYHDVGAICARSRRRDLISISIPRAASAFDISAELPFAARARGVVSYKDGAGGVDVYPSPCGGRSSQSTRRCARIR